MDRNLIRNTTANQSIKQYSLYIANKRSLCRFKRVLIVFLNLVISWNGEQRDQHNAYFSLLIICDCSSDWRQQRLRFIIRRGAAGVTDKLRRGV